MIRDRIRTRGVHTIGAFTGLYRQDRCRQRDNAGKEPGVFAARELYGWCTKMSAPGGSKVGWPADRPLPWWRAQDDDSDDDDAPAVKGDKRQIAAAPADAKEPECKQQ